jgi:putative hemolysin
MGLVTMDDVLEEIVGDIFDKSKKPHLFLKKIRPGELLVDGKASLELIEDHIDIDIRQDKFDTIAGLILKKLGRIPTKGETVQFKKFKIIIEDVTSKAILKVRVVRK